MPPAPRLPQQDIPTATKIDAPPRRRLYTGHFQRDRDYGHFRPQGIYDWLLIYTVRGAGLFTGRVQNELQRFTTAPGDVVLIEPDMPHGYATNPTTGHWDLLWAHFEPSPAWRAWLQWPVVAAGMHRLTLRDPDTRRAVQQQLTAAYRLQNSFMPHSFTLALNALEAAILWCDQERPDSTMAQLDPRIRQAVDHLCTHMRQPLRLDHVAKTCHLSTSRLAHLFRQQMGMPPVRFLEQQRLTRAQQLLESTDLPVQQIATETGFQNPFYFTLRFKRALGHSPTQHRKLAAGSRMS